MITGISLLTDSCTGSPCSGHSALGGLFHTFAPAEGCCCFPGLHIWFFWDALSFRCSDPLFPHTSKITESSWCLVSSNWLTQGRNAVNICVTETESQAEGIQGLMRTRVCMPAQIQYKHVHVCAVVFMLKLENIVLIRSCYLRGNTKVMDWTGSGTQWICPSGMNGIR